MRTPDEPGALETLDREIDNIRGALTWALGDDPDQAAELAGLLGDYWQVNHDAEGLAWLDAALTAAPDETPAGDRARLHLKRGFQLSVRWRWQEAIDAGTLALELYRESSDDGGIALAHEFLSFHAIRLGQLAEARAHAETACSRAEAAEDDALLGKSLSTLACVLPRSERGTVIERAASLLSQAGDYRALAGLYSDAGWLALSEGDPKDAIVLLDIGLEAADKLRTPGSSKAILLNNIALAHLLQGNPMDAHAAFTGSLELCRNEAFRWGGTESLAGLGAVLVIEGRPELGAQLLAAAKAAGYPGPHPYDQAMLDRLERDYFDAARAALGPALWTKLTRGGADMSFNQAIAFALAHDARRNQTADAATESIA